MLCKCVPMLQGIYAHSNVLYCFSEIQLELDVSRFCSLKLRGLSTERRGVPRAPRREGPAGPAPCCWCHLADEGIGWTGGPAQATAQVAELGLTASPSPLLFGSQFTPAQQTFPCCPPGSCRPSWGGGGAASPPPRTQAPGLPDSQGCRAQS